MASTDFAQFRLQQIRSIENQQVIEKLNIELKKQIEVLRATNNKPPPEDYKPKLATFTRSVQSWLQNMKVEMEQTKSLCAMQTGQISFLNKTLQETVQMMADQANSHSSDSDKLANENASLTSQLRKVQKELEECRDAKRLADEKNGKLSANLVESNHAKNLLAQNCSLLKEQIDTMAAQMEDMGTNYEAAKVEIIRLKQKIKKLEEYGGEALQAALQEQQMAGYQNELLIAELRAKNEEQELVITNLRLHIERLTAAMNGNKSHFAKFVELKNENAVLHTELHRTKGTPVSALREQQTQHVAQKQGQEVIEKMLMPNIPKGAIGAVDPSLVDYHASINSYISEVKQKVPGGSKGKTRPPPGGLKPYGKSKEKEIVMGISGTNSARNDSGNASARRSPRASADDSHASVSCTGKGSMFPRVAVLTSASTQNSRKPSPVIKGDNGNDNGSSGDNRMPTESPVAVPVLGHWDVAPNFQNMAMPADVPQFGAPPVAPFRSNNSTKNRNNSRTSAAV